MFTVSAPFFALQILRACLLSSVELAIVGKPHRTGRGELTLLASELPSLISPCLHDVPVDTREHEISPYERHVQFLAEQGVADILRARSCLVQYIRNFFLERNFLEVNTPIIAAAAGGATARPFHTTASESPEQLLALRIAPELWLKRLIIGGFDRVFEIGPSFRNEGIDKTHNPEFTTCEFYQAFADLECLIQLTENFLSGLSQNIRELNEKMSTLKPINADFSSPFRRLDFIPALESAMGHTLPDLRSDNATSGVVELYNTLSVPLPDHVSLPRLLDKLCSVYLEPQCEDPIFIINHPECMSPLSKSYVHPTCNQAVSARAELFVGGKEVMNMYEEENSPFEQRRKFQNQLSYRDPENPGHLDESYLQALEWGLPPTGGWGCGIDRLCMLFTGARRIGDVLSFGNLRTVTRPNTREGAS
ncbi:mitochondrial lysine-tRNA synthetase [Emydomyces testavorans]|uniref:Mitochondrial lysine-tRNA synthetase n=1 Tax=Emydomyces testavorans TaxID=2070801 RepID=A0AAF0DGT5_9EURO|nr:mitochondrial lysine-tRNA synthetase [Emydomyces testavorans]